MPHDHSLIPEHFHHHLLPKHSEAGTPPIPSPQRVANTNSLLVSTDLPIKDSSYKWNYTIRGSLCQASLPYSPLSLVCTRAQFRLMTEWCPAAWTRHVLFSHPSVGGRWGRFHYLAMMNNAQPCTRFWEHTLSVLWGIYSKGNTFWTTVKLFSGAVAPFHIPTSHLGEFKLLHLFSNPCDFLSFWFCPS